MSTPLAVQYANDRAKQDAAHPPITTPNRCRYCGRGWQRFGGTQFDGHVICVVSPDFQRALVDVLDTGVSYAVIGEQIGVSPNIVRAWWHAVKRRGIPSASQEMEITR